MAFLLDHLVAFVVGAALLVALLFVQQRGGQQAAEASIRYRTEAQAASFVETLTRDLENARTKEQAAAALGVYATDEYDQGMGWARYRALAVHGTAAQTEFIQFVTLADPEADTDNDATTRSDLIAVAYRMEPTGEQITARGQVRNLHQIVRYVYSGGGWETRGGSPVTVVGFNVTALPGGPNERIGDAPPRIDLAVEFANETPARQAGDQLERAEVGLTRQGATVRVYAAGTGNRAEPPSQGSAEIPRLPWVGPAPPPAPPSGPSTPSGPSSPTGPSGPTSPSGPASPSGPPPVTMVPIPVDPATGSGL